MRAITYFAILLVLVSCSSDIKVYQSDKEFVLVSEKYSPNKLYKIIEYKIDIGAYGYSRLFWAIIPIDKAKSNIRDFILPDGYKAIDWTSQNEAIIEKWDPYYYKSEEVDLKTGDVFKGVKIVIK